MLKIIGLSGKAGVGKDTFADHLVRKHGFMKAGFSDALYEEVAANFGVEVHELFDRKRKEIRDPRLAIEKSANADFIRYCLRARHVDLVGPRSPREILQLWGTDFRRAQDQDYWVVQMNTLLDRVIDGGVYQGVAIRDVRFANEAQLIRARGGKVYEILRPGNEDGTKYDHISEAPLSPELVTAQILNTASVDWLNVCADFSVYLFEQEAQHGSAA